MCFINTAQTAYLAWHLNQIQSSIGSQTIGSNSLFRLFTNFVFEHQPACKMRFQPTYLILFATLFFLSVASCGTDDDAAPALPEEYMTATIDGTAFTATNYTGHGSIPRISSFSFSAHSLSTPEYPEGINLGLSLAQNSGMDNVYSPIADTNYPEIYTCTSIRFDSLFCGQLTLVLNSFDQNLPRKEYSTQLLSGDPQDPFQVNFGDADIRFDGFVSGTFSGTVSNREDESDKIRITDGTFRIKFDEN
jgi:hypothetical protein